MKTQSFRALVAIKSTLVLLTFLIFLGYGDRQRLQDAQGLLLAVQALVTQVDKQDKSRSNKGRR